MSFVQGTNFYIIIQNWKTSNNRFITYAVKCYGRYLFIAQRNVYLTITRPRLCFSCCVWMVKRLKKA